MSKKRIIEPAWRTVELPVVDPRLCTGVGWCVAVCPTECLELDGPLPRLARPLDCVSCTLCVLVCPADALRMELRA